MRITRVVNAESRKRRRGLAATQADQPALRRHAAQRRRDRRLAQDSHDQRLVWNARPQPRVSPATPVAGVEPAGRPSSSTCSGRDRPRGRRLHGAEPLVGAESASAASPGLTTHDRRTSLLEYRCDTCLGACGDTQNRADHAVLSGRTGHLRRRTRSRRPAMARCHTRGDPDGGGRRGRQQRARASSKRRGHWTGPMGIGKKPRDHS